jgi:hypothetical protein
VHKRPNAQFIRINTHAMQPTLHGQFVQTLFCIERMECFLRVTGCALVNQHVCEQDLYFGRPSHSSGGWELGNAGNAAFRLHEKKLVSAEILVSQFPAFPLPNLLNQQKQIKDDERRREKTLFIVIQIHASMVQ